MSDETTLTEYVLVEEAALIAAEMSLRGSRITRRQLPETFLISTKAERLTLQRSVPLEVALSIPRGLNGHPVQRTAVLASHP